MRHGLNVLKPGEKPPAAQEVTIDELEGDDQMKIAISGRKSSTRSIRRKAKPRQKEEATESIKADGTKGAETDSKNPPPFQAKEKIEPSPEAPPVSAEKKGVAPDAPDGQRVVPFDNVKAKETTLPPEKPVESNQKETKVAGTKRARRTE